MEHPDAKMKVFDVRVKISDFFNVRTQKWVRPKCPWNAILVFFEYTNLVKFLKNLQNFLKRMLRRLCWVKTITMRFFERTLFSFLADTGDHFCNRAWNCQRCWGIEKDNSKWTNLELDNFRKKDIPIRQFLEGVSSTLGKRYKSRKSRQIFSTLVLV